MPLVPPRSRIAIRRPLMLIVLLFLAFQHAGCRRSSTGGSGSGSIRLNEVMAANQSFDVIDASGRPVISDWVELHNPTPSTISLSGYSLSDNLNQPDEYEFPPGAVLPAGGYAVVFLFDPERCVTRCIEDCLADCAPGDTDCAEECQATSAGCERECVPPIGYVANINLGATEDTIFLFGDRGRRLVDRIGVRNQANNISTGVDPQTGRYGVMYQPSPGAANGPSGLKFHRAVRITVPPTAALQPITIDILADRDVASPGVLAVRAEWVDVPSRGSPLPDGPLEPALSVQRDTSEPDPVSTATDRVDLEGNPATAEVVTLTYRVELPGAPCGTFRGLRLTFSDAVGSHTVGRVIAVCGEADLPTVIVNEYQPEHSAEAGVFFERIDADLPDEPIGSQDWIEVWNYGSEPVDVSRLGFLGPDDLQEFKDGGEYVEWTFGRNADKQVLAAGELFCVIADRDRRVPLETRKQYRLINPSVGDTSRVYFSTRFRLNPDCPSQPGDVVDSFGLVDFENRTVLDEVILDFRGQPYNCDVRPGQSAGRFPPPEGVGNTRDALRPGTLTNFATFETPNRLSGEVAPSFREDVTVESSGSIRSPRPGAPVIVRAQLNADAERTEGQVEVKMFLEIDPPAPGVEPELILSVALDQSNRAAGATLYDITASIPGLPDGTFVVFSFLATDLVTGTEVSFHDQDDGAPGRSRTESLRYVVGYEPPEDAPRLNEVMPGADDQTLYPPPYDRLQNDFAEIYNPAPTALDLGGYYLTTTNLPDADGVADPPINQVRRFRIPDGTMVPPRGHTPIFFGGVDQQNLPAGALHVDAFALNCENGEILYLVSPDGREAGGNSVVDSIRWRLRQTENPSLCRPNVAVGRIVDGCAAANCISELRRPSPGAANSDALRTSQFVDAFHQAVAVDPPAPGACVDDGPGTFQVFLQAVFLVDETLETALQAGVLTEATFLLDRGLGGPEETLTPRRLSEVFLECPATGNPVDCARAPQGYAARVSKLELSFPYRFGPVVRYRVRLVDAAGRVMEAGPFSFATASSPHPQVVINEINRLASAASDGEGEPRAWIELFNAGSSEVDLSGMYLTNLVANLRLARIPDGTRLAARSFLVVLTDGAEAPPSLHLPLAWSHTAAGGVRDIGTIFLVDSLQRGECVIDSLAFDFSQSAVSDSLGRDPDGTGVVGKLAAPTPGLPNSGRQSFVRGDANGDTKVNITDMVRILAILLSGDARRPACEDALDSDDNGSINVTDAVYIGNFVFRTGPAIPAPFPAAGVDPTEDAVLSCSD